MSDSPVRRLYVVGDSPASVEDEGAPAGPVVVPSFSTQAGGSVSAGPPGSAPVPADLAVVIERAVGALRQPWTYDPRVAELLDSSGYTVCKFLDGPTKYAYVVGRLLECLQPAVEALGLADRCAVVENEVAKRGVMTATDEKSMMMAYAKSAHARQAVLARVRALVMELGDNEGG